MIIFIVTVIHQSKSRRKVRQVMPTTMMMMPLSQSVSEYWQMGWPVTGLVPENFPGSPPSLAATVRTTATLLR